MGKRSQATADDQQRRRNIEEKRLRNAEENRAKERTREDNAKARAGRTPRQQLTEAEVQLIWRTAWQTPQ